MLCSNALDNILGGIGWKTLFIPSTQNVVIVLLGSGMTTTGNAAAVAATAARQGEELLDQMDKLWIIRLRDDAHRCSACTMFLTKVWGVVVEGSEATGKDG